MSVVVGKASPRLVAGTDFKIKGLMVQRSPAEVLMTACYVNWNWTRLREQIDFAVARGANTVRFSSAPDGVVDGTYTRAYHQSKMRQFLDYARHQGLFVYWLLAEYTSAATSSAKLAEIVADSRLLAAYPNVIAVDTMNEWILQSGLGSAGAPRLAAALAHQQACYPAIKAVAPELPVTLNNYLGSAANWTDNLASFYPYVDFWAFHPYYLPDVTSSDANAFRASPYYKPWLVDECGAGAADGITAQASRWQALGALSAAASDCVGVIGYTIKDADPGDFALISESNVERTHMTSKFPAWPSRAPHTFARGRLAFIR